MNDKDVRDLLRQHLDRKGAVPLARIIGVTHSSLFRTIRGENAPSKKILKWLGLDRVVTYKARDAAGDAEESK